MADQQSQNYEDQYNNPNVRIRDLEEKERSLRNKVRLIGENLVDLREKTNGDISEIKSEIEKIKSNLNRTLSFIESASEQFSKFARKEDLEILSKQAKMFQPLNLSNPQSINQNQSINQQKTQQQNQQQTQKNPKQ